MEKERGRQRQREEKRQTDRQANQRGMVEFDIEREFFREPKGLGIKRKG